VATYKDVYKLTYVRGPSGIIAMLGEELKKNRGPDRRSSACVARSQGFKVCPLSHRLAVIFPCRS
jgi:hypothetical protein